MKGNTALIVIMIMCSGCATTKTVKISENGRLPDRYWNSVTNCTSVPRAYSGVAHNACFALFGKRSNNAMYNSFEVGGYVLDSMASVVADTLVLPYSAYTQYRWGSIQVEEH